MFQNFGRRLRRGLAGGLCLAASGCGTGAPVPAAPLTEPTALCRSPESASNCRRPVLVERWLRSPRLRIIGTAEAPAGKQGARVLTLAAGGAADAPIFRAKWRAYDTLSSLNRPRAELAAYAVQKLFLDPHDHVVPPTTGHCFAIDEYRWLVDPDAEPTFESTSCVYGVLAYWLEDVHSLDDAHDQDVLVADDTPFDADLFQSNPVYRRSVAHLNMVTFLIHHGDSHPAQFLVTVDAARPRLYVVDNSIAFSDFVNPELDTHQDWSKLQVPALPAETFQRLRRLSARDFGQLSTLEAYERRDGRLVFVGEQGAPEGDESAPLRWAGSQFQIGLAPAEISALVQRKQALVQAVAGGELDTF